MISLPAPAWLRRRPQAGIRKCPSDLIAFLDLDDTYNPEELVHLCQSLLDENVDLVCGDRLSQCQNMPFTREIGNRMFKSLIGFFFQTAVADSCTGMRVFGVRDLPSFTSQVLPDNLNYSLAMTLFCLQQRIPLKEISDQISRRLVNRNSRFSLMDRAFSSPLWAWPFSFGSDLARSRPNPERRKPREANMVDLSIVIPTQGETRRVHSVLNSIKSQNVSRERFEILLSRQCPQ